MKKIVIAAAMCALMTGCVVGIRSNINFVSHENKAVNEANVNDKSTWDGSPVVNAEKSYSDLLNGSGNGNGSSNGNGSGAPAAQPEEKKEDAAPAAEEK